MKTDDDASRLSAAEYRTLRDACGLSAEAAAELHGVVWRTVQKWEVGQQRPSANACQQLRDLNRRIEEAVAGLLAQAGARGRRKPAEIVLHRYRSEEEYDRSGGVAGLSWRAHNAMLTRAFPALIAAGARVSVEWARQGSEAAAGAAATEPA